MCIEENLLLWEVCVKRREPAEEKGAQLFVVAKVVVLHSL